MNLVNVSELAKFYLIKIYLECRAEVIRGDLPIYYYQSLLSIYICKKIHPSNILPHMVLV